MSAPTAMREFAFSGSINRVREYKTEMDGSRYCITVFSLHDYKYLHFPHEEYMELISKLYAATSPQTLAINTIPKKTSLIINQIPFTENFELRFGCYKLQIGPVTAFGIIRTAPFGDYCIQGNDYSSRSLTCMPKYDICVCGSCTVLKRLTDFEKFQKQFNNICNRFDVIL